MKGRILVILQFILILSLLKFQPLLSTSFFFNLIKIISVVLGVVSLVYLNKSKLSIYPNPRKGAFLINSGPYKMIRHPMYTSILLFFVSALFSYEFIPILLYIVLLTVLVVKLNYEELLLIKKIEKYEDYTSTNWKLLPFIY